MAKPTVNNNRPPDNNECASGQEFPTKNLVETIDDVVDSSRKRIIDSISNNDYWRNLADNFIDQVKDKPYSYDGFVFLDGSARMHAKLIRARWKYRFPEEPMPKSMFVAIGKHHRESVVKNGGYTELVYPRKTSPLALNIRTIIDRVRHNHIIHKYTSQLQAAAEDQDYFAGKRLLIVDEFMDKGEVLPYAEYLLQEAFPEATIEGCTLSARSHQARRLQEDPTKIQPIVSEGEITPEKLYTSTNGVFVTPPIKPNPHYRLLIQNLKAAASSEHKLDIQKEIDTLKERIDLIVSATKTDPLFTENADLSFCITLIADNDALAKYLTQETGYTFLTPDMQDNMENKFYQDGLYDTFEDLLKSRGLKYSMQIQLSEDLTISVLVYPNAKILDQKNV